MSYEVIVTEQPLKAYFQNVNRGIYGAGPREEIVHTHVEIRGWWIWKCVVVIIIVDTRKNSYEMIEKSTW